MKRIGKIIVCSVLSASMAFSLLSPVIVTKAATEYKSDTKTHAQIFNGKADQYSGKTVILHSNDVHGQIDGYAYIAELEDDFEEAGAEVITVDAGDYSQGSPNVSYSKGANAITMMNAAGYEIATLGNHEFDYGYSQLKKNMKKAKFKVLCADVLKKGKTICDPSYVYDTKSGVKIGFFGMETPETKTKTNPKQIKGLTFYNNTDGKTELFDCGEKVVSSLKKKDADIIIGLVHLGVDDESMGDGHRSIDLYDNVTGIDMLIDGHSHSVMTEGPSGEPIQSTGTKFANIGVVVIDDAKKQISDHYLVSTDGLDKDEAVEQKAQKIIDKIDDAYGEIIAESNVVFASEKSENRCYETNTGNLVTDAMMWQALKDKGSLKVAPENVIAIINGGTLRAGLNKGDVTKKDIQTILPFGNTMYVVYVKGSSLLEVLEASTFMISDSMGGYPQTKGIKFTIDQTKEYDQGEPYPDSTYYKPASIQRIKIKSVNGKKFKKNNTYAILTTDFNAAGGDTYYVLKKSKNKFDTGLLIDEIVSDYIETELKGKLTAKKYKNPRGDVKQITE